MKLIQARWIAPMDQPPIRNGAVLIDEARIIAVGSAGELRHAHRPAEVIDLPRSVLLPGLVNAHVHLELSDCRNEPNAPVDFVSWLATMVRRAQIGFDEMERKVSRAIQLGVAQCQRFGVTTVGDISRQVHLSRRLLRDAGLRVVSFGEITAMAQRRAALDERLAQTTDRTFAGERLIIGITPHSPYSVEIDAYRRCLDVAKRLDLPLATHLAESPHEAEFLASHRGPFRDLWDKWLAWDDQVPRFSGGPIRMAQAIGLLDFPSLLAHVNYCDDAELDLLAHGRASVIYCPRTHAFFEHRPHRWREMLARGINVAVGTDSCASSPDLNLLDDLRLLRKIAPDLPANDIWKLATTNAARALRLDQSVGSLTPGKFADLIGFEIPSNEPLDTILHEPCVPHVSWFNGVLRKMSDS